MMRAEPHKEDHIINIVARSGMAIGEDKGKWPETDGWVHKASKKDLDFDLNRAKEAFMEAKKKFAMASTSGSQEEMPKSSTTQEVDTSVLDTFLKNCMKLLRDKKELEGMQDLIDKCANKQKTPSE